MKFFECLLLVFFAVVFKTPGADDPAAAGRLTAEFEQTIHPLIERFCLDCHATDTQEGELDLERFASMEAVKGDPPVWERVIEQLGNGEMPPTRKPQPSATEREQLSRWAQSMLDMLARANAGDPGPVVLRRLSNAEYTYTLRDLTRVNLDPAREFPVDGAAGEGFMNTGNALVMSPALLTKYLDAGKAVSAHAVLLPGGLRFSEGITRRDWTDEILQEIRSIYVRHTTGDGDMSLLDRWTLSDPTKATANDGRVDLARYLSPLLHHRQRLLENPDAIESVAREERINARYAGILARMLASDRPSSFLLDQVRVLWRESSTDDPTRLVSFIRGWQDRLWKFNPVGHFGSIRPWQEAVTPLASSQEFRLKLDQPPTGSESITVRMAGGSAGDGNGADLVEWRNPRIERPGKPPLSLRDVRGATAVLEREQQKMLRASARALAAAFELRTDETARVEAVAGAHNLDPAILRAWLSYLGVSQDTDPVVIKEYLTRKMPGSASYEFVKGWGLPDVADLSLVSNSSDNRVTIPGVLNPHTISVHPRPERWIAVGWQSPVDGRARLQPAVADAHNACGNGIGWSFEWRHGNRQQVLRSGQVDLGTSASIEPVNDFEVRKGDLISLVINARDGNHVCDLTEIDITIEEVGGETRRWSLSADCADSIHAGNPHPDGHGNPAVWHFYTGLNNAAPSQEILPRGSLLDQWLATDDPVRAADFAAKLQELLSRPLSAETTPADAEVHRRLVSLNSPLLARLDLGELAARATAEELSASKYGMAPEEFGRHPEGQASAVSPTSLVIRMPALVEFTLPGALFGGGEFVVAGGLHPSGGEQASVQLLATTGTAAAVATESVVAGLPIIVKDGSEAAGQWVAAFEAFRELFPASMCHARIVPVDETVTLVLFHREDHHLARLMLSDQESQRLDGLWEELRYVSQDALTMVAAYEQLMEYATQDADPRVFEPLRKPIHELAATLRKRLSETEPAHLEAVLEFASRAYRRPLETREAGALRALYSDLREQRMDHDEAIRLTLARVLASPVFLYRIETPVEGVGQGPVSGLELATRLSYFLWSSLPDTELRDVAERGRLHEPEELLEQTRRLLKDDRVRRLAVEFACQWLHIRDFDHHDEKSERHFPEFAGLRDDMYEESVRFFTDLFQRDGTVLSILNANHTYLNEALAKHYGIPGVSGSEWRRVSDVRGHGRGGILAQATTLAKQSGASRTSPILRGNWISETLLGEKLPRPPKDVPQLPDTVPEGLTERQLIERHASDAACAKCHKRIDPYGFALEEFDAIGRFRRTDSSGHAIDTRTMLVDGTPLDGIDGLRNYLLTERRQTFVRQFCRKLLGYALGRGVQLSDQPLLDEMLERLGQNEYRMAVAIEAVVGSRQFLEIRGRDAVP